MSICPYVRCAMSGPQPSGLAAAALTGRQSVYSEFSSRALHLTRVHRPARVVRAEPIKAGERRAVWTYRESMATTTPLTNGCSRYLNIPRLAAPAAALIGASHTTLGHVGPRSAHVDSRTTDTHHTEDHHTHLKLVIARYDVANSRHTPRRLLTATTLTVRSRPMVAVAALAR